MQTVQPKGRLLALKDKNSTARLVEIAKALAASEMEALACQLDYDTIIPLRADWSQLFTRLPVLGPIMALTRNEWVVHESKGQYAPALWKGPMGLVQGENIDLHMFASRWKYLFAVQVIHQRGILQSLQIFDDSGSAVHKIYLEPGGNQDAFQTLVQDLRLDQWQLPEKLSAAPEPEAFRNVTPAEIQSLRHDWSQLQDAHEFSGMLRNHRVSHLQAMHMADPAHVREVGRDAVQQLLVQAHAHDEPLMALVGNSGMIQIYGGRIRTLKKMGDWLNVMDPTFNLYIDGRGVHRVFVVHKPTRYGTISSLEVFSVQGDLILSLFGYRKDDQQPPERWGQLLASLPEI